MEEVPELGKSIEIQSTTKRRDLFLRGLIEGIHGRLGWKDGKGPDDHGS